MSVIDHIEIPVNNANASLSFYEKALAPLGFRLIITQPPVRRVRAVSATGLDQMVTPGFGCMTMRKPPRLCISHFLLMNEAW